ncbi:MAG: CinA family protein [Porphyromonas sp.]|nr:CinA family protein [Porphyromonas sp.]
MTSLVEQVALYIRDHEGRLATAESCTGGLLAHQLTSVPGASEWYHTGVVAYTEESKRQLLGLTDEELRGGLVTRDCAEAMARRVAALSGADYAISTTGVCGPAVSEGYPPCTAWIGVATPTGVFSTLYTSEDMGRSRNKELVAYAALDFFLSLHRS